MTCCYTAVLFGNIKMWLRRRRWKDERQRQVIKRDNVTRRWQTDRKNVWRHEYSDFVIMSSYKAPPLYKECEYSLFFLFRSLVSHTFLCRRPSIFCLQVAGESEHNCLACARGFRLNLPTKWQKINADCGKLRIWKEKNILEMLEVRKKEMHYSDCEKQVKNKKKLTIRRTNKGCEEHNNLTARGEVGD